MKLTLLGTGTSFGVPVVGCDCAVCRSSDPRDRRSRCAALVEVAGRTILIDTPPELRLQLLAAGTKRLDAVLYTHTHADHIAGIDDLRAFSDRQGNMFGGHLNPGTVVLAGEFVLWELVAGADEHHRLHAAAMHPTGLAAHPAVAGHARLWSWSPCSSRKPG